MRASSNGVTWSLLRVVTAPRTARFPSGTDILIAFGSLTLVGLAAYGWYVLHGGLYADDWGNVASYRLAAEPKYWNAVREAEAGLGARPVLALLLPLPAAAFGTSSELQLLLALCLGILTSLCFYLLLRTLGMRALEATIISALALLFPWSDAIRLWTTASLNSVAVCAFLIAVVIAVLTLNLNGARGILTHGLAVCLYIVSVMTYEVAAAAVLLAGILYLGRGPIRGVLWRWLVDCLAVVGALVYSLVATAPVRHVGGFTERLRDVPEMTRQSVYLLVWALVPFHGSNKVLQASVGLAVAAVVAIALVCARRPRTSLRHWLLVIAASSVAIGAAYFILLGSYLHPQDPGLGSRANVFAGLGYAALVYALIATASQVILRSHSAMALAATLFIAGLVAVGYGVRLRQDEQKWTYAADLQRQALTAIAASLPEPKRNVALITFDLPAQSSADVPVFFASWDLQGALQTMTGNPRDLAFPVYDGVHVTCGRHRVVVDGPNEDTGTARYRDAVFLDLRTRREERIGSPKTCRDMLARFPPGPLVAEAPTR